MSHTSSLLDWVEIQVYRKRLATLGTSWLWEIRPCPGLDKFSPPDPKDHLGRNLGIMPHGKRLACQPNPRKSATLEAEVVQMSEPSIRWLSKPTTWAGVAKAWLASSRIWNLARVLYFYQLHPIKFFQRESFYFAISDIFSTHRDLIDGKSRGRGNTVTWWLATITTCLEE